ncbi:hypothetical protein A3842_06335 [Paenibacillus sp. P3E]|uniref:ABC transporter permease subunit n=1 Tax=unclassified Paenibacillus TaxID=185978 RepID=UPI0009388E68|nr:MULTISPECIES: ABC transporter permease subunit [unclassified Paenibacillus]OKP87473.1 hypothetical protein A3842_06335 [Paenibacillus sp. P3E]OKP93748.1 hypothetical protein A3848_04395 [Paenibacillus sp. P32E]
MNFSLYKAMMKGHGKFLFTCAFTGFLCLYLLVMTFPLLSDSQQFNDVIKSLPKSVMDAFGIQGNLTNAVEYMAMNFYNSIYLYLLMAYTILTACQLVSRFVDRGSMAYLLSTPVTRRKVINTQAAVLVTGLVVMCLFTYLGGYFGVLSFVNNSAFDLGVFTELNLIVMLIFLLIGSYSFLFSCIFDEEKTALGAGFGVTLLFYGLDMVSKLSEKLSWLKYCTIFTLYQPEKIIQGTYDTVSISLVLVVVSILIFAAASFIFQKRDLSL